MEAGDTVFVPVMVVFDAKDEASGMDADRDIRRTVFGVFTTAVVSSVFPPSDFSVLISPVGPEDVLPSFPVKASFVIG